MPDPNLAPNVDPIADPVPDTPAVDPIPPVGGTVLGAVPDSTPPVTPDPTPDPAAPVTPDPAAPPTEGFNSLPADWREQLAGDDKAYLNALRRHTDVKSALQSGWEAQQKIRKGEVSTGLPENPTDEQVADWREANGVPESPDKYELKLNDGLVLGEQDKRIMEGIYKVAHDDNIPAAAMSKMTNELLAGRQREVEAITAQDGIDMQQSTRLLKDSMGGDYQTNRNMVENVVLNSLPTETKDLFINGRLANGMAIMNSPEIFTAMADWARKIDPAASVVPDSINQVQAIDTELAELKGKMGEPGWHKNIAGQDRYQALLRAKEDMDRQRR